LTPNPFTPNGDGVNDRLQVVFSVLKIDRDRRIEAEFSTLNGVPVARLAAAGVGGQQVLEWDGRDVSGAQVPPGIYLCRIHVDTDEDVQNTQVRVVSVVY
jgi:flagellar hook assembly protein FlgD